MIGATPPVLRLDDDLEHVSLMATCLSGSSSWSSDPSPLAADPPDMRRYERIFEEEFPETKFVSMGSDRQIVDDQWGLAEALRLVVDGFGGGAPHRKRDARSDQEVTDARIGGVRVLSWRILESYRFDDEVPRALAASEDKQDQAESHP